MLEIVDFPFVELRSKAQHGHMLNLVATQYSMITDSRETQINMCFVSG